MVPTTVTFDPPQLKADFPPSVALLSSNFQLLIWTSIFENVVPKFTMAQLLSKTYLPQYHNFTYLVLA